MKKLSNSFYNGIAFLTLLLLSFAEYFDQRWEIARRDQIPYMRERAFFPNTWDWLWQTVNFNRTRWTSRGDAFLYRPLLFTIEGLNDILFAHRPEIQGAVSIAFWAFGGFAFYLFGRRYLPSMLAFLFAVLFISHASAMELVLWRHISPYILAIAFLTLGLAALADNEKNYLAAVAFFVSCILQELAPLTLLCAVACLSVIAIANKNRYREWTAVKVLAIPMGAFALAYVIQFTIYPVEFLLHPKNDFVRGSIPWAFYFSTASIATSFFFPMLVNFQITPNIYEISIWNFDSESPTFAVALVLFVIFYGLGVWILWRSIREQNSWKGRSLCLFLILTALAVMVGGLALGRGLLRGEEYLQHATYYCGYSAMIFYPLAVCVLSWFLKGAHKHWIWGVEAVVVALIGVNAWALHQSVEEMNRMYPDPTSHYDHLNDWLEDHTSVCLRSFDSGGGTRKFQFRNLAKYFCDLKDDSRTPVTFRLEDTDHVGVYESHEVSRTLLTSNFNTISDRVCNADNQCEAIQRITLPDGCDDIYVETEVSNIISVSLIVGFHDAYNFRQFGIYPGNVQCQANVYGQFQIDLCHGDFTWFPTPTRLGIHYDGRFATLFINGWPIAKIPETRPSDRSLTFWKVEAHGTAETSQWRYTDLPERVQERKIGTIEL